MRIIAVMSPKGGIGKTTTSDAIAYMLGEEQEKRVLILDGDPQGDTSKTFEAYEPEGTGMSELLERHVSVGGSYRTTDLIRPTQYSHIDIRRSIVAEKASMRMAVLPQFSKNCIVSQDYRNVVHELLKEMEG